MPSLAFIYLLTISTWSCGDETIIFEDPCDAITCPSGQECQNGNCVEIENVDCTKGNVLDSSRGACLESLEWNNDISDMVSGNNRIISSNSIPDHLVGLFGGGAGSLNPNAISEQNSSYSITNSPTIASSVTLLSDANGPSYSFGVILNGVELDPVAAEPWPHDRMDMSNVNWDWNLEALGVNLGLDCNNAHVQPTGKYHYHASPTLYIESLGLSTTNMTMVGYAGDGFPIYYKYGYNESGDHSSGVKELASSYRLKSGSRPGDGDSAPCGDYDGIYSADYEFVDGLGDLDECNGREGVTPEYPSGTYYYIITSDFPAIPRCFVGTPSNDFKIGM